MNKINLLYNPDKWCNINTAFLEKIWDQYFFRSPIDNSKTYDKKYNIIYANGLDASDWIQPWIDKGYKVIIDQTWESHTKSELFESSDSILVLYSQNWHRCLESLWYVSLGYDQYIPNYKISKSFIMTMNLKKPHRDLIYNKLKPILNDAIYSYHGIGIPMVGGEDIDSNDVKWQRYINPNWYDSSKFSVVVESHVNKNPPWLSEKTYKPLAFYHPIVKWASPNSLKSLRDQGFETFDNVIDESYDQIIDNIARLDKVCSVVNELTHIIKIDNDYFNDSLTQQKLKHNRNTFYDVTKSLNLFKTEIIDKILEFANL